MLDAIVQFDRTAVLWMCERRARSISTIMKGITRVGDGQVWTGVILAFWLSHPGDGALVRQAAIAFGLDLLVYKTVKTFSERQRPFVMMPDVTNLVLAPDLYSFPSGHTAAAFVMTIVAGSWFPLLGVVFLPLALLIGVSRVYLGVHYPSDVFAGALLGIGAGVAGVVLG